MARIPRPEKCVVYDCQGKVHAKELCNKHYISMWRKPTSRAQIKYEDGLWEFVQKELGLIK